MSRGKVFSVFQKNETFVLSGKSVFHRGDVTFSEGKYDSDMAMTGYDMAVTEGERLVLSQPCHLHTSCSAPLSGRNCIVTVPLLLGVCRVSMLVAGTPRCFTKRG